MTGAQVVVWGNGERALAEAVDALSAREEVGVSSVETAPPWGGSVDCVVTSPSEDAVGTVRQAYDVPVVLFGDADGETVRSLLAAGASDVVQAGGNGSHAVLAERIEQAIDETATVDEVIGADAERIPPGDGEGVASVAADNGHGGEEPASRQDAEILEVLDDGVYALDRNGRCSYVNEGMVELSGYDEAELLGSDPGLLIDARTVAAIERTIVRRWRTTTGTVSVDVRTSIERSDGERVPCELHMNVLADDDGNYRGTVGVMRDVSERERRQELLTRLQETSRSLMQAPSRETVARIVTDAAQRTLGFDMCVFRLYDPDDRTLVPVASTSASEERMGERPVYDLDEGPPGEVFVSGEPAIYDDVQTYAGDDYDRSPARAAMYFPIGVHGVMAILTSEAGAFDDVDEQIATLLATNAAAACNRAKREREVRDARERIATILERINGLVEDTIEVLVQATTREEVEAGVCEQLAAADPYVFAWIARPDVREGLLTASEWAGDADIDVRDVELCTETKGPGVTAFRDGTSEVLGVAGMEDAAAAEPWLEAALDAGVESVMAVPLDYRGGSYGVLTVCSDHPEAFDDRERVVLEALGRAVANAINTVESGRILEADTVIELSVAIDGGQLLLGRLSAATGADLASAGTMTQDDGALRLFLTASGADAAPVADALDGDEAVHEASVVAELDDESLFDASVRAPLIETLVDHGAVPKAIAAENGITRLTVELPNETAAREAFAIVEDRYPNAELVGYHEHERPVQTQQEFRAALSERFTDRQETALRTAYLGGFFDAPRGVDGSELADGMDISRPTYHQHLRAAQRKVFEELFEADATGV